MIGSNEQVTPALLATDIDGTLILEGAAPQPGLAHLRALLIRRSFIFAVATGRNRAEIREVLGHHEVPDPDVIISDVGTRISYGWTSDDVAWTARLNCDWDRREALARAAVLPGLSLQPSDYQSRFKISFDIDPSTFDPAACDRVFRGCTNAHAIISRDRFLDVLPRAASKGRAISHVCGRLGIPALHTLVCGDSGNDADMLTMGGHGVVVGNYSPELDFLRGSPRVYFTPHHGAAGILDGMQHHGFLGRGAV